MGSQFITCRVGVACVCLLAAFACGQGGGAAVSSPPMLVWNFADGLQGWQPTNWESLEVTPEGVRGISRYDCQLLSPELQISAEDYPVLVAYVRTTVSGSGETFFAAPGERLSDDRKAQHTLVAEPGFRLYRVDLRRGRGAWAGPIGRLRFDPLNPAGAEVTIAFLALLSRPDQLLFNGDVEIAQGGVPFRWRPSGTEAKARLVETGAYSGRRALWTAEDGAWQAEPVDLSFLGELRISGAASGGAGFCRLDFLDEGGELVETVGIPVAASVAWTPFEHRCSVPRRAFDAVLTLNAAGDDPVRFDAIGIDQESLGHIVEPPPPRPRWRAAWIWHPAALDRDHHRVWLRRRFAVPPGDRREAILQITADDGYALAINGTPVHATSGETDAWRVPELLDVGSFLREGDNAIAIEAADVASAQGVIAELAVVMAAGDELRLHTDASWEAAEAAEGPWVAAAELGRPPCLPWGDLPYTPIGRRGTVRVSLEPLAQTVPAGAHVSLTVAATVVQPLLQEVGLRAVLRAGERILAEVWADSLLFREGASGGESRVLRDWSVLLPPDLPPGDVTVRIELSGADAVGGPFERGFRAVAEPPRLRDFPRAAIRTVGGVPRLTVNGSEVDPTQNLFIRPDRLQQTNAAGGGVAIWSVALDEMGFFESGFDYAKVDRTLAHYAAAAPHVWLIPTFTFDTRHQRWWIQRHPEARCRLEDGSDVIGDYHGGRRIVPSYGSALWREAYGEALRQLIRHLRQTPHAERIIGFHPCSGISWEWFHWGSQSGELVDYSEAGQEDFRRWLRGIHGDDAALQAAWRDPAVTLATARIPPEARRRTPDHGIFYDPRRQRDVLDYHAYQHDVVAETILHFGRIVKEETGGRCLYGTYYGYVSHLPETPGFCQGSGHFRLAKLLAAPEIDFLMAPVAYAWRELGGSAATMTAAGSFALHNKLFWNQADLRTHWSNQAGHGRPDTVRGSIACMERELARNLTEGSAIQWYDFSNGWTFGDERLAATVDRLHAAGSRRRGSVDWPPEDYLLVVVDELQMGTFDPFNPPFALSLVYRQREFLARAGVPWRMVLFDDLQRFPELLRHRLVLLLNLFSLDDARASFVRRLMADGRTVAALGPIGIVGPAGVDPQRTGAILGWPMALADEPEGTVLRATLGADLPAPWSGAAGVALGVDRAFRPVALPLPTGDAKALGHLAGGTGIGVAVTERVDHRLFWSAAPGLPPALLRALAAWAGLPVVSQTDDPLYTGCGFVALHAASAGSKELVLPGPTAAVDILGGTRWPAGTTRAELQMAVGQTVILRLGEP